MALFDSLKKGSSFIDDLQKGRILDAKARYAEPMAKGNLFKLETENKYLDPTLAAQLYALQTENQYLPERLRLANQFQGLANTHQSQVNQFYPETTRQDIEYKKHQNTWYDREAQSKIDTQKAMANFRNMSGGITGGGVRQKEIMALQSQLMKDHPDWDAATANQAAGSYLLGEDTLSDGSRLPPLSGIAQSYVTGINKRNSSTAIQNQAASLANTANELNDIDISPAKKFAGLKGKSDYMYQKIFPGARTEDWRKYDSFRNVDAVMIMDTLRKSLSTSVVPGYVNETIGKFSNPNDEMWDDPIQVEKKWKTLVDWVNKSAKNTAKQADRGATTKLDSSSSKYSDAELNKMAKDAIAKGADPKAVEKRMMELRNV